LPKIYFGQDFEIFEDELGISCISSELDRLEASYGFSFR
jgi:hypothetical protein